MLPGSMLLTGIFLHFIPMKRRSVLKNLAAAAAWAPVSSLAAGWPKPEAIPAADKPAICIFSKHLQFLDYEAAAETAVEIGFDGVDLAVRPRGHVLPQHVERDLPKAVEAMKKAGLTVPMMTTAITSVDSPHTQGILETAAGLGIGYYRMGYYRYDKNRPMQAVMDEFQRQGTALAALNEKLNITACYQNHAGARYVGAPIWDLGMMLRQIDSAYLGCQYDIRHATVEGGQAWPLGLEYIYPYIHNIVVKDFHWAQDEAGKWYVKNVPVGAGMVDFAQFLSLLKAKGFEGPISLHVEYKFHEQDEPVASMRQKAVETMKRDVQALRTLLQAAGW